MLLISKHKTLTFVRHHPAVSHRVALLAKVNVDPSVDKGTSFMDAGSVYFKDLPIL